MIPTTSIIETQNTAKMIIFFLFECVSDILVFNFESTLFELFKHISRVVVLQILQGIKKDKLVFTNTSSPCISHELTKLEKVLF